MNVSNGITVLTFNINSMVSAPNNIEAIEVYVVDIKIPGFQVDGGHAFDRIFIWRIGMGNFPSIVSSSADLLGIAPDGVACRCSSGSILPGFRATQENL